MNAQLDLIPVQRDQPTQSRWIGIVLLMLIILGMMTYQFVWLFQEKAPTIFDDSSHLFQSLQIYDALHDHGWGAFCHAYLNAMAGQKGPLICVMPVPLYFIVGRWSQAAFAINLFWTPIGLASIYGITRRFKPARTALCATIIYAMMPIVAVLSYTYLSEYGLAALTVLALWLLITSDDMTRTGRVFWFGVVCGFGTLQKLFFPMYIFFVLLYFMTRWIGRLGRAGRAGEILPSPLLTLAAGVIPFLLISSTYYAVNLKACFERAIFSGFNPAEADLYGTGEPFTWAAVSQYLTNIFDATIGGMNILVAAATIVAALIVFIVHRTRKDSATKFPRPMKEPSLHSILFWWTIPFVMFLFGRNKDPRFIAPLLPIFAIWVAIALEYAFGQWRMSRYAVIPLLVALQPLIVLRATFWPNSLWHFENYSRLYLMEWPPDRPGGVSKPDPAVWPLGQAVDAIAADYGNNPAPIWIETTDETRHFNSANLLLAVVQKNLPFDMTSTAGEQSTANAITRAKQMASYVVFRDGGTEDPGAGSPKIRRQLIRYLRHGGDFVEIKNSIVWPDGGVLHIYRNLLLVPKK
jgi:4-amino-4-deoxy-L-arabinose transferase-like glycosyltransferase